MDAIPKPERMRLANEARFRNKLTQIKWPHDGKPAGRPFQLVKLQIAVAIR